MGRIKITDNSRAFFSKNQARIDWAFGRMVKDILNLAKAYVPFKSGDLQKSGQTTRLKALSHKVGFYTNYSAYQERGARGDGTRRVKRYSTPGTGANFLKRGGDKVASQAINYIKEAVNTI